MADEKRGGVVTVSLTVAMESWPLGEMPVEGCGWNDLTLEELAALCKVGEAILKKHGKA